jgi:thiamine biosynthesis lipoprotein
MTAPRRSHRRQFLQGRSAADALADLTAGMAAESLADAPPAPAPPSDNYVLHVGRRAMACQFEVYFNAGQYPQASEAALAALDLVDELEAQLSVYRPDSELGEINRRATTEAVPVEPRLFELLEYALELHRQTGGAYDITSGALSAAWGFARRAGAVPSNDELAAALATVGSQHVVLDPERQTVRFLRSGLTLNLGSVGKGYSLDRCGELLADHGVEDYLLHGGQSSVLARGERQTSDAVGRGWPVGIAHPLRPERRLAQVWLQDRALGTSGSGVQYFHYRGRRLGHILDPRTGWPAEGVLSTTVLAPTAQQADALSTALFILGPERGLEFCQSRPELAVLFVCPRRGGDDIELVQAGFAADALEVF